MVPALNFPAKPGRLAAAGLICLSLIGCGYKGPLYLPPPPDVMGDPKATNNTTSGGSATQGQRMPSIPPMRENPSLEPAPIVIQQ